MFIFASRWTCAGSKQMRHQPEFNVHTTPGERGLPAQRTKFELSRDENKKSFMRLHIFRSSNKIKQNEIVSNVNVREFKQKLNQR